MSRTMKTNMDTTKIDFRLAIPPAWPDDVTYCQAKDCAAECYRKECYIDWEIPRHKYYGASISDLGPVCTGYQTGGEHNVR